MQLDSNQISQILPHRYPFALVDRITDGEEGSWARGIKCVSVQEPRSRFSARGSSYLASDENRVRLSTRSTNVSSSADGAAPPTNLAASSEPIRSTRSPSRKPAPRAGLAASAHVFPSDGLGRSPHGGFATNPPIGVLLW